MKKTILLLAVLFFLQGVHSQPQLQEPLGARQARPSAPWVKNGVLYEIFPRDFSPEGTFAGIERKLPELKKLGVTILWLMPIHPIGLEHRKGSLGSPYSVRDYYAVNPDYGTLDDFKRLVASAHKLQLKVIIDMVANHTSWDSKLITEHPEWFTKDSTGHIVSPVADWSDVADLDYSKPALRQYMIQMLEYWVRDIGIDGYRCDVAEMVPTDFWNEARAALDKIKPVFMLSEGQYPEHLLKAFDATYGWNLYHQLELLIAGEKDGQDLDGLLASETKNFPKGSLRLRFSSNHDENAWDYPDVIKYGLEGAKLCAVIINTFPGMPLLYNGQEAGSNVKLGLFEKKDIDWTAHPEFRTFYTKLFQLRTIYPELSLAPLLRMKSSDTTHIYAFTRPCKNGKTLAVVYNFTTQAQTAQLTLPGRSTKAAARLTPLLLSSPRPTLTVKGRRVSVVIPALGYAICNVE